MRKLAQELNIPYTTYVNYEKGVREPSSETLIMLADYFGCSVDFLIGRSEQMVDDRLLDAVNEIDDDILEQSNGNLLLAKAEQMKRHLSALGFEPIPPTVRVPRLGVISCGDPIDSAENFDGFDDVPEIFHADFTLRAEGDSMIGARIQDGDIVYIRQQATVETGQIAAVLIDGTEKLLKRVYLNEDSVVLQAENPAYPPRVFAGEEMNRLRIIGLAVGFSSLISH